MRSRLLAAMVLATIICLGPATAAKDNGKKKSAGKPDGTRVQLSLLFSNHDREMITTWIRHRHSNLPPGLARKGQLPPGLQKQLAKNGSLPPGLEKRIHPLPTDLERSLAPLPADYHRVAIEGSVLILHRNTRLIADVFVAS